MKKLKAFWVWLTLPSPEPETTTDEAYRRRYVPGVDPVPYIVLGIVIAALVINLIYWVG